MKAVANHPFVDANKRTALNTVVVCYFLNGYRFEYDAEIRTILKQFDTDEGPSIRKKPSRISESIPKRWI